MMKTLKFKIYLLLLSSFLIFPRGYGQNTLTREFEKEFPVKATSKLVLDNRYGSITVKDWDQKKVAIEVIITVENAKRESAERYLDMINIDFSQDGDEISVITRIDEKSGRAGSRWFVVNNENKLSIDYTVQMPKDLALELRQRYGDAYISELTGQVDIDIRYGNLTMGTLTRGNNNPLPSVSLSYSKGSIAKANWLNLDLKYSEVKLDKAQAVIVVSKYSRITIEESSSVVANSRYDRYTLGELNNLVINGAYTNINATSISNKTEIETRYGGVKIDKIPSGFAQITINSSYTNVNMGIDPGASYQLSGNVSYGNINYPQGAKVSRISKNSNTTVTGNIGNDESSNSAVTINVRYGNINLVR